MVDEKNQELPTYEQYLEYMKSIGVDPLEEYTFRILTNRGFNVITKKWVDDPDIT